jgi:hypothetical protein
MSSIQLMLGSFSNQQASSSSPDFLENPQFDSMANAANVAGRWVETGQISSTADPVRITLDITGVLPS